MNPTDLPLIQRLVVLVVAALIPAGGRAENWPEFRGPSGQGHANGAVPTRWGPEQNVLWKAAIPGQGWSSPVVVGQRVYLTTSIPANPGGSSEQSLRVLCLEAATGNVVWNTAVFRQTADAPGIHKKNSHASSTPVFDVNVLYVHFGHQGTACVDLNGRVVWRNTELAYSPVHGNGGSPVVVDHLLIFHCDGGENPFVAALDKRKGTVAWKTPRRSEERKKFSFCTPLLIEVDGKKQLISPGSGGVFAYEPYTGREIWRVNFDGYSVVPRPVYGHGLVYISTGFDRPVIMAIRPTGTGDVTDSHVAWTLRRSAPNTPSPLLVGDDLYLVSDSGIASCVDARTGKIHWQERVGGNYSASPMYAGGKIYLLSEEGKGVVLQPGHTFQVLQENELEERALASYAAADQRLFIRTESHLYAITER